MNKHNLKKSVLLFEKETKILMLGLLRERVRPICKNLFKLQLALIGIMTAFQPKELLANTVNVTRVYAYIEITNGGWWESVTMNL